MQFEVLRALSDAQQRQVLAATVRHRYARNEVVFHEGDLGDALCLVTKGRAAVRVSTPLGDIATLRLVVPGDAFGEQALFDRAQRRNATVVALEPFETLHLGRDAFERLLAEHPPVGRLLVEALALRVQRLNGLLLEAYFVPADIRVLRRLVELAAMYGPDDAATDVEIPLAQETIATMAGTTRPTVNRLLRSLEHDGVVALSRNKVVVMKAETLRRRAR